MEWSIKLQRVSQNFLIKVTQILIAFLNMDIISFSKPLIRSQQKQKITLIASSTSSLWLGISLLSSNKPMLGLASLAIRWYRDEKKISRIIDRAG